VGFPLAVPVTVGEASRQYQVALEARRTLRGTVGELSVFEDELAEADPDMEHARQQLIAAWPEAKPVRRD